MSTTKDAELSSLAEKYFPLRSGREIYKGFLLSVSFQNILKNIEDLEIYDDDIWVCTFPKSGTTWAQEMVWCLSNNLDLTGAEEYMEKRFVFLEQSGFFDFDDASDVSDVLKKSVDLVNNMKRPRFIKTHLPWVLLPKQIINFEKRPKIINVARNPMDTFVSSYHFAKMLGSFKGDIEIYSQLFLNNKIPYTPLDEHILSYWNRRNEPNVLCLKFEDMKTKLSTVIDTVAEFVGKPISEEGKVQLISHLSFDSMKKNRNATPAILIDFMQKRNETHDKEGHFMRSGKVGGYRSEMSEEAINLFQKRFVDKLENAGLKFPM